MNRVRFDSPSGDPNGPPRQLQNGSFEGQAVEPVPSVAAAMLAGLDVAANREPVDLLPAEMVEADEAFELLAGGMRPAVRDPGKPLAE